MTSSPPLSPSKPYTCDICGTEFNQGWSDEEAIAELKKEFPGFSPAQCSLVCDGCYKQVMTAINHV